DQPLVHHRVRDFQEAGDVGAIHIVSGRAVLLGGAVTDLVNGSHDVEEPGIDFFPRPGDAHAVLRHLQTGGCDTAGVRGFPRAEKDSGLEELIHAGNVSRHVGAFGDDVDAVPEEICGVFAVDFVLGRTGKGAVGLVIPNRVVIGGRVCGRIDGALELVGIFGDAAAPVVLQVHDERELVAIDAGFVVDVAV